MIKPTELLSSLTFVIITLQVKNSLYLNYFGMFKLYLMLGLEGNGSWGEKSLLPSSQSFE